MNVAAISFFQELSGHEFMYVDWIVRILPFFILTAIVTLLLMFFFFTRKGEKLEGTKDYFEKAYAELGTMKRDEKICGTLFLLAMAVHLLDHCLQRHFHHWSLLTFSQSLVRCHSLSHQLIRRTQSLHGNMLRKICCGA